MLLAGCSTRADSWSPQVPESEVTIEPSAIAADGASVATVTVRLLASNGAAQANQKILLWSRSPNAIFVQPALPTDSNGLVTGQVRGTAPGTVAIGAQICLANGPVTLNGNAMLHLLAPTATPAGPSATMVLTVAPMTDTVDNFQPRQVTLRLSDANGSVTPDHTVILTAARGGDILTMERVTTDASGLIRGTLLSTLAGHATISAHLADGTTVMVSPTFLPGAPKAVFSAVTADVNILTADPNVTSRLTARIADQFGNKIPQHSVSWSSLGGPVSFSAPQSLTDTSGMATTTAFSLRAQQVRIVAQIGPLQLPTDLIFVPGAPSSATSTLSAMPDETWADGQLSVSVASTFCDAYGNPTPGQNVTWLSNGANVVFSATTSSTDANGMACVWAGSTSKQVTVLTGHTADAVVSAPVSFVGYPDELQSTLIASPNDDVVADHQQSSTISATIRDASGQAVASQSVSLAISGAGANVTVSGGNTDASGLFQSDLLSTIAGAKTVTLTAANVTLAATVSFVAGPADAAHSELALMPSTVIAGGNSTATATLQDAYGNPCGGQNVSFALSTAGTVSPPMAMTDANGRAFSALVALTQAGTSEVAVSGAIPLSATLTVSPNVVTMFGVSGAQPLPAGGRHTVRVAATDAWGNVNPNFLGSIKFSSSDGNAQLPPLYPFQVADAGVHVFVRQVRLMQQGTHTLSVTSPSSFAVGSQASILIGPPVAGAYHLMGAGTSPNACLGAFDDESEIGSAIGLTPCTQRLAQVFAFATDDSLRLMNMCLQPVSGTFADQTPIEVNTCSGAPWQQWQLSNGQVQSLFDGNYCLDPMSASATSALQISRCSNANTQALRAETTLNTMTLLNDSRWAAMDTRNGSLDSGTALQSFAANTQSLSLTTSDQLRFKKNQCVDTDDGTVGDGKNLVIRDCSEAASQKWSLSKNHIRPQSNTGLCVNSANFRSQLYLSACGASSDQNWIGMQVAGAMLLKNRGDDAADLCVQLPSATPIDKQAVQLAPCSPTAQQLVTRYVHSVVADYRGGLSFPFSQPVVSIDSLGQQTTPPVQTVASVGENANQAFLLGPNMAAGSFSINCENAASVALGPDGATPTSGMTTQTASGGLNQQFIFLTPAANFSPLSANELCLAAQPSDHYLFSPVIYSSCDGSDSQRFFVPESGEGLGAGAQAAQSPITLNGLCLDSSGSSAGSAMLLAPCSGGASQNWTVPYKAQGPLQNGVGLCLNGAGASIAATVTVVSCDNSDTQQFVRRFY